MNTELIKAIEKLTDSVRNLNGKIHELMMSLTSTDSKLNYLSEKLEENTKEASRLTQAVIGNTFK